MIDVRSLLALLDDEVLVKKYLKRFMEDMPRLLSLMQNAYETRNWKELSIHAHSFKSQMQYINETVASGIAYDLEILSSASHPEAIQIERLIIRLENQLQNTLEEIQRIIG